MINFIEDLFKFLKFKKKEKYFDNLFFVENKFLYQYLLPYIPRKSDKKKIIIFTFEEQKDHLIKDVYYLVLKTNFFRELFFLTLKIKYIYCSTPDLNNSFFKKTKLYQSKYIYIQHSPISLTAGYNKNAFKYFDAIQAINKYQFKEIIEIAKKFNAKIKPFKSKYKFILNKKLEKKHTYDVVIAPTWNTDFYKNQCHIKLAQFLREKELSFIIRPHPASYKKKEITFNELSQQNINIDKDYLLDFNKFNFLISDWSGIYLEYALIKKQMSFLINTPRKILNNEHQSYNSKSIELDQRENLGKIYELNELEELVNEISKIKLMSKNNEIKNFYKFSSLFY